jgi:hypothetical protein
MFRKLGSIMLVDQLNKASQTLAICVLHIVQIYT